MIFRRDTLTGRGMTEAEIAELIEAGCLAEAAAPLSFRTSAKRASPRVKTLSPPSSWRKRERAIWRRMETGRARRTP